TGEGQEFTTENLKERQQAAQMPKSQTALKPKSGGISKLWLILGVIAVIIIGGIIYVMTSTKSTTVAVSGFRWEREIRVESLQAIPGKTNCDSVPMGAYSIDRNYEQIGSHSEPDGQTCQRKQVDQGDGTFREEQECTTKYKQVPDYGYMCTYVVNTWTYSRSLTSEGDKTVAVSWPKENLSTGNCLGCEREANRNENYYLQFTADGKAFECPVSADEWNQTTIEQAFSIKIGTVLKDARCDTLERAK
ncbi:MAG: hypothetical protein K8I30_17360, partial [Anaerolineae bacterium]|nr:hypothetical protein [Anaerolineae bacterium]